MYESSELIRNFGYKEDYDLAIDLMEHRFNMDEQVLKWVELARTELRKW